MSWDPFRDLMSLQDRMNRLFEQSLRSATGGPGEAGDSLVSWSPAVDIYETGDELVLQAELPGFARDGISIDLEGSVLVLSGERTPGDEAEASHFHQRERPIGTFQRRFTLPAHANGDRIQATFDAGLLTVRIPRKAESRSRRIEVG